jgi:predicted transcriptional regulator
MQDEALDLTATIVSSYVANNTLPTDQLKTLICEVYKTLSTPDKPKAPVAQTPEPMVPVRKSLFTDYIICLCCGRQSKTLKGHLRAAHAMTVDEYREKWGLPPEYPMVAPSYAEVRSKLAKDIGLGHQRRK